MSHNSYLLEVGKMDNAGGQRQSTAVVVTSTMKLLDPDAIEVFLLSAGK